MNLHAQIYIVKKEKKKNIAANGKLTITEWNYRRVILSTHEKNYFYLKVST